MCLWNQVAILLVYSALHVSITDMTKRRMSSPRHQPRTTVIPEATQDTPHSFLLACLATHSCLATEDTPHSCQRPQRTHHTHSCLLTHGGRRTNIQSVLIRHDLIEVRFRGQSLAIGCFAPTASSISCFCSATPVPAAADPFDQDLD